MTNQMSLRKKTKSELGKRISSYLFLPLIAMLIAFTPNSSYNSAQAATSTTTTNITCSPCKWYCLRNHICYSEGNRTFYGHGSGTIVITETNLLDVSGFGLVSQVDCLSELPDSTRKNVYVGDGENPEHGTAYFNVPIARHIVTHATNLLIEAPRVIIFPTTYEEFARLKNLSPNELLQEIGFSDEAIEHFANPESYLSGMMFVHPNPTSGTAFARIQEEYFASRDIQSIRLEIYGSNQSLLTTTITDGATNDIPIASDYLTQTGTYFVICRIEYLDEAGLTRFDNISTSFIVIK